MSGPAEKRTLQARLVGRLERDPGRRAISFMDAQGKFSWYSLEQFTSLAAAHAARLADHGLGRGDVCLIVLPSSERSASLLMATLLLGGVPLLIAPPALQRGQALSSLEQVVIRIMRRTRPRVVILPESMTAKREELVRAHRHARVVFGETELLAPGAHRLAPNMPAETAVAAMQLTSGTTGFPRVCVWRQKNVVAALDGMGHAMGLTEDDVCLNWTPLYHDMGLVNNFFLCLTRGVPLVMISPTDFVSEPSLWLRGLHAAGATTTWSPNFGFALAAQRVEDAEIEGVRLDGVRAFWNAAERIHYETMVAFRERFAPYGLRPEALKTNFGCAENVGGATFSALDGGFVVEHLDRALFYDTQVAEPLPGPSDRGQSVAVVSAGRAYPGMRIRILSPRGRPLPDGHVGEVALGSPSRMMGYLNDAKETRHALFGDLLRTGDLAYVRNGELFWVGRVRERITVRGKKLDPSEFERVLLRIPDLRSGCFAAFGIENKEQGTEDIVLVAEVRKDSHATREAITGKIRHEVFLGMGLNVGDVVLVRPGTLSKTSSGKRRHRYFHRMYLGGKLEDLEWVPSATRASAAS